MSRLKAVFRCEACGYSSPKWLGQCPECQAWNTLAEEASEASLPPKSAAARVLTEFSSEVVRLDEARARELARVPTRLAELDRLLGGGVVPGQVLLLAGPPGIGKSTLMLQAAAGLGLKTLYVSGEESLEQVSSRGRRLGLGSSGVYLVSETSLARVLESVGELSPGVLVLDSIQTVHHPDWAGGPGSVGQVRECAAELLRAAKSRGMILFLLGHVTKEGELAGPRVLEHIVDTVLYFDAERDHRLRILRVHKNRFGPSSEVGLFEMGEKGLSGVEDASGLLLSDAAGERLPGRAVSVALEGSRPLVIEVQALVIPTRYPLPRRAATGLDLNRTLVLIAALEKHLKLRLESRDVFLSLAGGMRPKDPALDLAVCMALAGSSRDAPAEPGRVFLGEVGLLGQVGRIPGLSSRLKEAVKLGFREAVVPARCLEETEAPQGMRLHGVDSVASCVERHLAHEPAREASSS